jgi:hypothetical protein
VILKVELTHEEHNKINQLKALKSHTHNFESLLMSLVEQELKKWSNTDYKKSNNPRYVSTRLKNSLLKKAAYKCQHPGCEEVSYLQIDYIQAVRHGGKADPNNLQVLCSGHNRGKG